MANNFPPSDSQSHWPPHASGSMTPQSYASPYPMQYHPGAPQYFPQPYEQFHPGAQSQYHGMPSQNQPPPFYQSVQQYHPWPMHQYQPSMPMDSSPLPMRCKRTDGKKWRCSRNRVVGSSYCERHKHKGRQRLRKPVDGESSLADVVPTGGFSHDQLDDIPIVDRNIPENESTSGCGVSTYISHIIEIIPQNTFH